MPRSVSGNNNASTGRVTQHRATAGLIRVEVEVSTREDALAVRRIRPGSQAARRRSATADRRHVAGSKCHNGGRSGSRPGRHGCRAAGDRLAVRASARSDDRPGHAGARQTRRAQLRRRRCPTPPTWGASRRRWCAVTRGATATAIRGAPVRIRRPAGPARRALAQPSRSGVSSALARSGDVDGSQDACPRNSAGAVPPVRPRCGEVSSGARADGSLQAIAAARAARFAGGVLG